MFSRYIVPALAIAGSAYAQCSVTATTTLTAASDATAIAGCATFSGSIALATSIADTVVLDGMQQLNGDLMGPNIFNLTVLSASTLQSISGSLSLNSGPNFNTLAMPALTSVNSLTFVALGPKFQSSGFNNLTSVQTLTITDTFLQSLQGITLDTADTISIQENQYLSSIEIPITSLTGTLTVSANAGGQANASFPELTTLNGLTIQNCSSVSLPKLVNVTGPVYATGNNFQTFSLPALTSTDVLTVDNNNQLTSLSVPKLANVEGALNVWNNSAYQGNLSFPALTNIQGSAYFVGGFSAVSIPKLNTIQGVMDLNSTADISNTCSHFQPFSGNVVHGTVTCNSASSLSSSSSPSGSSGASGTSTSPSSTGSSTSAATSSGAATLASMPSQASTFTVFGMLAAVFGLLM